MSINGGQILRLDEPNYTQVPNSLIAMMPELKGSELKVALAIVRQTFGWRKECDKISLSQLQKLTGMGRQGTQNGINGLLERGVIGRKKVGKQSFSYHLLVYEVDQPDEQLVHEVDRTSPLCGPELVHKVDTQKKEKETIQKKDKEQGADAPAAVSGDFDFSEKADAVEGEAVQPTAEKKKRKRKKSSVVDKSAAVKIFHEKHHLWPAARQTPLIDATVEDLELWSAVTEAWVGQGYKPLNVRGQLDWYEKGIPSWAREGANNGRPEATKRGSAGSIGMAGTTDLNVYREAARANGQQV